MEKKKESAWRIIVRHLRDIRKDDMAGGWVKEYNLVKLNTRYGWLSHLGDRRARELAQAGIIDRREIGYAEVRFLFPEEIIEKAKTLPSLPFPIELLQKRMMDWIIPERLIYEQYERELVIQASR